MDIMSTCGKIVAFCALFSVVYGGVSVAGKLNITIPYRFTPRPYQRPLYNAPANGFTRGVSVWHRRAGKDKTYLNLMVKEAVRVFGTYYYFFPTYNQGKKILWDGIDTRNGMKFMDHLPHALRTKTNESEMKVETMNGSIIQIIGTDNIDSIVGSNPRGCVFSEYSLQDPRAWQFIRPILLENGGWAFFNFTPRGKNHAYSLYKMAQNNPEWFCELLTIDDTGGIITPADIERERREGMPEEMILQEYYCSFEAPVPGAIFAKELVAAEQAGRIGRVTVEPTVPVNTFWDLGIDDSTSIWLAQDVGREVHMVGYYESQGVALVNDVNWLRDWRDRRQVTFGTHVLPHDGGVRQKQTGKTTQQVLEEYGFRCDVTRRPAEKRDGIEASRQLLNRTWFDEDGCSDEDVGYDGLSCLRSYRRDKNDKLDVFGSKPVHDWASHGADAYQTCALWHQAGNDTRGQIDTSIYTRKFSGRQF